MKDKFYLNEENSVTRLTFISLVFFRCYMHYTFQTLSLNLRRIHVAGFIFLCCLVRFAGFHYILSMLNYMIIYLLPVNESLIYDSLRSYNGAKKCITCVWYIEFFLL